MSTVLYLSPHLDDVVLSCGCRMLQDTRRGRQVVAATVFSDGDQRYQQRREEDRRALELLGAECRWLGLPDAPHRRDCYRSYHELVLQTHQDDVGYESVVSEKLSELCQQLSPDVVVAPLGVGGHVDHRLVHSAARAAAPGVRTLYYEDRPYCLVRHAVRMRLGELQWGWGDSGGGSAPSDLRPQGADLLRGQFLSDLSSWHWLDTYLPAGPERDQCRDELSQRFDEALRQPTQATCSCQTVTAGRRELELAAEAAQAYASQFEDLFASPDDWRRASAQYAARIGAPGRLAERYWEPL